MAAPDSGGTNFHFDDLDAETVASENGWIGPDVALPEQTTRDVDHMTVGVIRRDARRREEAGLAPLDYGGDPKEMESWGRHADSASGEATDAATPADVQPVDDADMSDPAVQTMFARFNEMFGEVPAPADTTDGSEGSATPDAHYSSGRASGSFGWTGGLVPGEEGFDPDEEPEGEPGDEPYDGDDDFGLGDGANVADDAGVEAESNETKLEPDSDSDSEPKSESQHKSQPRPKPKPKPKPASGGDARPRTHAPVSERPREIDGRIMAWSLPPLVRRPPRGECVVSFEASGDPSRTQFGTVRGVPFSGTSLALATSMMPDCFEADPSRVPTFTGPREAVVYVRFAVPPTEMGRTRLALSKAAWAAIDGGGTLDEMMARALLAAHFSVARQLMAAHRVVVPLRDASWGVGGSSALVLSSAFQSRSDRAARIDMARRALSQALESERVPASVISALASPLSTSVQVRGSTAASTRTSGHILGMPVELWVHVVRFSIDVR